MNSNHCSERDLNPEDFRAALLIASTEQRLTYAEMSFKQRSRTRYLFYSGHALGCCLRSVLNNVSPPAWHEPYAKPDSHGCPRLE
ncbi:hypothetical protein LCGC14_1345670 [marine sediment metagenome]|uniref:Uncharacterized protein n=1 Tax=marine sediment metagenome TaxID=412755 RepID=A0A0F9KCE8_9ZZZZ